MAKFNLNDYELVEDRLKKFWKDNPNGRVETEVIHITDDGSCVTVRALCYKDIEDINPVATGIAQETKVKAASQMQTLGWKTVRHLP